MNARVPRAKIAISVVLILGISSFLAWKYLTQTSAAVLARMQYARLAVDSLVDALEEYRLLHGQYPTQSTWFIELQRDKQVSGLLRYIPVREGAPIDPWGHPYEYLNPGNHSSSGYDLWTFGADSKPGGEGENGDIKIGRFYEPM